jgi:hypothetical protein
MRAVRLGWKGARITRETFHIWPLTQAKSLPTVRKGVAA